MAYRKAAVDFAAHTNTPRKTAIADFAFTTEKRQATRLHSAPCWTIRLGCDADSVGKTIKVVFKDACIKYITERRMQS